MMESDKKSRSLGPNGLALGFVVCVLIAYMTKTIAENRSDPALKEKLSIVDARLKSLETSVDGLMTDLNQVRDRIPNPFGKRPTGTTRESVGAVGAAPPQ